MKSAFLAFPLLMAFCAVAPVMISACGSSKGEDLFEGAGGGGSAGAAGSAAGSSNGGAAGGQAGGAAGQAQGGAAGQGQGGASGDAGAAAGGAAGTGPACEAIGHDEDGDGLDDACDNCPSWPNSPQMDSDGDGLGDMCELPEDPAMLSKVMYFEPFVQPTTTQWDGDDRFKLAADALLGDDSPCAYGCGANAMWTQPLNGVYGVESVFVRDEGTGWAGLLIGEKTTQQSAQWIGCLVQFKATQHELQIWKLDPGEQSVNMVSGVKAEAANVPDSTLRRLRVFVRGESLVCRFENSLGNEATLKANSPDPARLQGRTGLRVYQTQSSFRSVSVLR